MTDRPNGMLYTGVTSDLTGRVRQHQGGFGSVFTSRYKLHRLVYYELYADITDAIRREAAVKRRPRAWNVRLTNAGNPDWNDLAMDLS